MLTVRWTRYKFILSNKFLYVNYFVLLCDKDEFFEPFSSFSSLD